MQGRSRPSTPRTLSGANSSTSPIPVPTTPTTAATAATALNPSSGVERYSSSYRSATLADIDQQLGVSDFIQLSSSSGVIRAIPMDHLSTSIRQSFDDIDEVSSRSSSASTSQQQQQENKNGTNISSNNKTAGTPGSGGIVTGSGGVSTAPGVSPIVGLSDEEVALSNSIVRVKGLIGLLLVISILTLAFFTRNDWKIIMAAIILLTLCLIGLRGVFRSDAKFLKWFWWGLSAWSAVFVACIAIFLGTSQLDPYVSSRCNVQEFLNKGNFGANCTTIETNPCYQNCLTQVNTQLMVEVAGFSALIGLIMLIFANSTKQLATDLTPATASGVASDVDDEETARADDSVHDMDSDDDNPTSPPYDG